MVSLNRSRVYWLIGIGVAAIVIVAALIVVRPGASAPGAHPTDPPSTPEASTTPMAPVDTPAATTAPDSVGDDVAAVVTPPLAGMNQSLADPSVTVDLSTVASGVALADVNSEQLEYQQQGLHQEGSITIASSQIVQNDEGATPPTMVIDVCLDRSGITVLDADGKDVGNPDAPTRVRQIWTMQSVDGAWKLVDRSFDDELSC